MLTEEQAQEILRGLKLLPADKVDAVRDFISFLQTRYGEPQGVDESDAWADEDLRDFTSESLRHAESGGPHPGRQ